MPGSSSTLLLFGGASSGGPNHGGAVFGDLWSFDTTTDLWTNLTSSECGGTQSCPAPRWDMGLAVDSYDGNTVMFGGCGKAPSNWTQATPACPVGWVYGDTWNLTTSGWKQAKFNGAVCGGPGQIACPTNGSGKVPAPRYASVLAGGLEVGGFGVGPILFGGCGPAKCPLGDTWQFQSGKWTQIGSCGGPGQSGCGSNAPSARWGASGSEEQSTGVLLFGGCGNALPACSGGVFGDTWSFSVGSSLWSQVAIQGQNCGGPSQPPCATGHAPAPRYDSALAGWPSGPDVCLFGGSNGTRSYALGDSWGYKTPLGPLWVRMPSTYWPSPTPSPRLDEVIIGGDGCQAILLFGGTSGSGSSLADMAKTTHPGTSVAAWISPGMVPPPRVAATAVWDSSLNEIVLFGGCSTVCPSNDTWIGTYCTILLCGGVPNLVNQMEWLAANGPSPPPRTNASMTFDSSTYPGNVVLYGGTAPNGSALGDLWTWNGGWTAQTQYSNSPPGQPMFPGPRYGSAAAYNTTASVTLLFGGYFAGSGFLGDYWKLANLAGFWTWTYLGSSGPSSPSARAFSSLAYDSTDGYLVLFGGLGSSGALSDSWKYGPSSWGLLGTGPSARYSAALSDDPNDKNLVLFGGVGCSPSSVCNDTWNYTGGHHLGSGWSLVSSPVCQRGCPSARSGSVMVFDSKWGAVDLFGGGSGNGTLFGDQYGFGAGTWVSVAPWNWVWNPLPSAVAPSGRYAARMAFDAALNSVILIGGCPAYCTTTVLPSVWEFTNGTWWGYPSASGPPAMYDPAVVYYPPARELVVTAGWEPTSGSWSSGTWLLSSSNVWSSLSSGQTPYRADSAAAYFPPSSSVILFGGCTSPPKPFGSCDPALADTWKFSGSSWSKQSIQGAKGRGGAGLVYVPSATELLLADGWNSSLGGAIADDWVYDGHSWSVPKSSVAIPARYDFGIAYDTTDGTAVAYGGLGCSTGPCNSTWITSSNFLWGARSTPSNFTPPGLGQPAMTFDPSCASNGLVLLYGGYSTTVGLSPGLAQSQTWGFLLPQQGWVNLTAWA